MPKTAPVHTLETACQDCYRCVRECPVKAIRIVEGSAAIIAEECLACGHCVAVCPHQAKQVRDDRSLVEELLAGGKQLIASVAPSWTAALDLDEQALVAGLRALGFAAVGQTAAGAEVVSSQVAKLLDQGPRDLPWFASACPASSRYLSKHRKLGQALTPLLSPLLAHCRMLKARFGEACQVVFFGPCIAKKLEADAHPELLCAALTFADLLALWQQAGIEPGRLSTQKPQHFLDQAQAGRLYPVEGGMIASMGAGFGSEGQLAFSGMHSIDAALSDMEDLQGASFIELLACDGGCINGPGMPQAHATCRKRLRVLRAAPAVHALPEPSPSQHWDIQADDYQESLALPAEPEPEQLRQALASIGKEDQQDELNCGSCGYESCRSFAKALIAGRAEPAMCAGYMRRLAQRTANTLLRAMPMATVLVDAQLSIHDANQSFARLVGAELSQLVRGSLAEFVPCTQLFTHVLEQGSDIVDRDLRVGSQVWRISLFPVESGRLVAALISDVTEPTLRRDEVTARARAAIEQQLATVQQVAYLLGESASESEVLLRSIVDAFAVQQEGR